MQYLKDNLEKERRRPREAEKTAKEAEKTALEATRQETEVYVQQYERDCAIHFGQESTILRQELLTAQHQSEEIATALEQEKRKAVCIIPVSASFI